MPKVDPVWCEHCLTPDVGLNWTSGDTVLDEFIRSTQRNVRDYQERFLEWVPWERIGEFRVWKDKGAQKYEKKDATFMKDGNIGEGVGTAKAKKLVAVWFDSERDRCIGDRSAPVKVILEPLDHNGFFTLEYFEKVNNQES